MRALTVQPGVANSARVEDVPEPPAANGSVLVQALALGVCGTDLEITSGAYGWAPPGRDRLVLGHESLGRVLEAPADSGLAPGDLIAGIVRMPDPVPCPNCAVGEWDMCRNGRYTEHGIKEIDGFASERWRVWPHHAVKVAPHLGHLGVLMEPASVLAKAWDHVERIGRRAVWQPKTCLVTGAGPIGLLAALMGRQRGLEVHVLDRITDGPKPQLVKDLGAEYHTGPAKDLAATADVVIECTGVGQLVFDLLGNSPPGCVTCLTGISSGGRAIPADFGTLNKSMVLENDVVFGSVNANRRHYELAAEALAKADPGWLGRVVNRRVPLADWRDALTRRPDDVKPVITLGE
ncbi:MAG: glucose 1-dehydrogenase [Gemmataceae bacterium]|nr:glucose 1-dehydrogenase [Gemmataceae bacterium]